MSTLLHSPFLQALGYAIIHNLWQFALLWLLYFFVNSIFKLSSHQKYTTGLVLELAGFLWFAGTFIFYYKRCIEVAQSVVANKYIYLSDPLTGAATSIKQRFFFVVLHTEQFFPYLSLAYLALLCVLIARWLHAYNYTQKVRSAGLMQIDESWQLFVQKLSHELGINRFVQIYLSEAVQTPLTVGFFKPFILIPLATINYLTPPQMEAVILHELAHIRRYDYIFNLLLALIEACLFYNPFMQIINQQIKKERENCCDDWVLKYKYNPSSYARALLQIASHQTKSPLLALKATDNKNLLVNRIKRIIENKEHTFFNYKYQLLALLAMTFIFSLLSFLSPYKQVVADSKKIISSNIVLQPMAAKVRNPLFNPVFFLADSVKSVVEAKATNEEVKVVKQETALNNLPEPIESVVEDETPDITNLTDTPVEAASKALSAANNVDINNNFSYHIEKLLKDSVRHFNKIEAGKLFIPEAPKLIEIQFKKDEKRLLTEASALNLEKVKLQLQTAFARLKSPKKQVELGKLQSIVKAGIRKIQREKIISLLPDMNVYKLNELEQLEKQIESELDSINKPDIYTTGYTSNVNYCIQLPAVSYTLSTDSDHIFSYEYNNKTKARVIEPSTKEANNKDNRNERVIITNDDDDDDDEPNFHQPPLTPVHLTGKARKVYIIKI